MEPEVQHSTKINGCKVCFNPYDCNERRPRSLPCGHTFCSLCLSDNLREKKVVCPSCRREHGASTSIEFPVNYELESFLQEEDQTSSSQQDTETISNLSSDTSRCIMSKSLKLMKQQFTSNMGDVSSCSQEACSQLHQYKSQLMEWRNQHQENLKEHRIIVNLSDDMIKLIDKETLRVDETFEEGKEKEGNMKKATINLTAASTANEVSAALGDADFCYLVLGKWTQGVEKTFPDTKLVTQSQKLKERSKYGRLMSSCCSDEETSNPKGPGLVFNQYQNSATSSSKEEESIEDPAEDEIVSPSSTIEERVQKCIDDDMPFHQVTLTVQTHISSTLEVQDLVNIIPMIKSGVYAVKRDKDDKEMRYAKITLEQNQLYLHVLRNMQNLPQDALLLQYDEMKKQLVDPSSSRLTFLELGVEGRSLGTLTIRLSPQHTRLTQQFSLLCTGEMGPSYADTNSLGVVDKGHDEKERVLFGDYERNDGSGGKEILPGVDWEKESKNKLHAQPWVVGSVCNAYGTETKAAQFVITTSNGPKGNCFGFFGLVEEGMSILSEAVSQHPDIKKCFIRDCGIVLNL